METQPGSPKVDRCGGKTESGCEDRKEKPVLIPFLREGQRAIDRQESKTSGILDQKHDWQLAVDL